MCNRLPEINKNGDAGIFPVYYSLNFCLVSDSSIGELESIVGCTFKSGIGSTLKYRV